MSQKQVAGWLKGITLSIAGMGLLFFGLVVPYLAWDMAVTYPDYAALRIPGILYGKAGAWTGISDFYDSAHFYQCGDRGACGGAVPSDL